MPFLAGQMNALPLAAALVAVVWFALRGLKGVNAATRYVIWWLVLVAAVVIPLVPREEAMTPRVTTARATQPEPVAAPMVATLPAPAERSWQRYESIATVVLVGVGVARLGWVLASLVGVWWTKRRAHFSRRERTRFRGVRILESATLKSPVACGYLRPAIVLPREWGSAVDERDLHHVMLHELAHLARFDDLGLLAQRVVQAVFWWNPLVWIVARQLDLEREIACDDWAIAHSAEGVRPYAWSLTRIVELRLASEPSLLAPGAVGRASQFAQRIERLMDAGRDAAPRVTRLWLGAAAVAVFVMTAAAVSLPSLFAFEYDSNERRSPAMRAPRGSFLAGVVRAGYGNLSVDEIIALKDHGVDGAFMEQVNEALGQKLAVRELIELRQHGTDLGLARALREAAIPFDIRGLIEASNHGVRAQHIREAQQYKSKLAVREIIRLKESGVI